MKALTTKEGQASINQIKTLKFFGCEYGALDLCEILKKNTTLHLLLLENTVMSDQSKDIIPNFPQALLENIDGSSLRCLDYCPEVTSSRKTGLDTWIKLKELLATKTNKLKSFNLREIRSTREQL